MEEDIEEERQHQIINYALSLPMEKTGLANEQINRINGG
jgi:hypothetical protein